MSGYKKIKTIFQRYEEIPNDWNFVPLAKIGKIAGGGTPKIENKDYWNGSIPWAVPTDITDLDDNYISKTERYISEKGLENSAAKLLPVNTVIITSRATIGQCAINEVPLATNQGFQNLQCNPKFHNWFIFYAIQFHKPRLLRLSQGTTFLEISNSNMKKIEIPCPDDKHEQEEISKVFLGIDMLIQKNKEIIGNTKRLQEIKISKNLEILKQGLMQKLLTGQMRVVA